MAFIERYSINANGAVTFTGNTLGLSRSETPGVPGTVDSIGAYITTDTTQQFGTYPPGTTNLFLSNSSAAVLQIPAGSTILYAELIWGGTYIDNLENNSAFINNSVQFTTPLGLNAVTPDSATMFEVILSTAAGFPTTYAYVRSADVTALVTAGGAGTYITGGVVGTLSIPDPTSNHAGWTLGVVYQNAALPLRNMSLRVAADVVLSTSGPVTMIIDGFATPFMGPLSGRAQFSTQEGDANKTGDQALFGPTVASLTNLSGPNNFANNFFASQINGDTGALDTSGTFGTRNQINGTPGTNIVGGRQSWDITNVDISTTLLNTQTQAFLQLTTNGDGYLLDGNGLQIDINTPTLSAVKSSASSDAIIGDIITYTVDISNTSLVDATNVMFFDNIPDGSSFVTDSITINGVPQPGVDPVTGVLIGTLLSGTSASVTFQVLVTSLPNMARLFNQAKVGYTSPTVPGGPLINTSVPSNAVTIPVFQPNVTLVKSSDTTMALVGDTVTYTLSVSNIGNIDATTTIFDNIPDGSVLIPGSVTINGVVQPTDSPLTGIPIGPITPNTTFTITFQVNVVSQPAGLQLVDQGIASYTFQPPDGRIIPGSVQSNIVTIPVSLPVVNVNKTASAIDAVVGDTVTYSIIVSNQDGEAITNAVLTDNIPDGSVFVLGSVTVDAVPQPAADPVTGIALGTLSPLTSKNVTFSVSVTALPVPPQLADQARVDFTSGTFNGTSFSDVVTLPVYQPIIAVTKVSVPTFAVVGESLTFQLTVTNTGNIAATTVLSDIIPAEAAFVAGSVLVNNISQPGDDPNIGIPVGILQPGGSAFVTFQIVVNTLPATLQIINQANASFTFTPPDGRIIPGNTPSNQVIIPISSDNVTVTKTASELQAIVGDIVTYTLLIQNNDPIAITNVTLTDPIPSSSVLVPDSVTVNGVSVPGADPSVGLVLGTIVANGSATVTFQVSVVSTTPPVPFPLFLTDQATVGFTSGDFTGTVLSNIVNVRVFEPIINLVKSAVPTSASVGDIITYTIVATNQGNYNADVILLDPLPLGVTFVPNSVLINGNRWSSADPLTGINLGTLQPQFPLTVTFLATVTSLPVPPLLVNQATGNYTYTLPDGRVIPGSSLSNEVTIPVTAADIISVTKAADRTAATVGDTITYTLNIINNTPSPVNNVVLTDPIPIGSLLVQDSVIIIGVSIPGEDPSAGLSIGTIGANDFAIVSFQVVVVATIPPVSTPLFLTNQATVNFTSGDFIGSTLSNVVNIGVFEPVINLVKSAVPSSVTVGNIITYTVVVTNQGNYNADVTLLDPLPSGETFVPGSVTINGVVVSGADPAIGIPLGTILSLISLTVTFQATVTSLPAPPQLVNQATGSYTYTLPDDRVISNTSLSNEVTLPVTTNDIIIVTKIADKTAVVVGDTITFTLTILNTTSSTATNVVLTDPIPPGSILVSNSVTLNGVQLSGANPASGILIGSLAANASASVTFQVSVTESSSTQVLLERLSNQASLTFTLNDFSGNALSNMLILPFYRSLLSIVKAASPNEAVLGDTIEYRLIVLNEGNISADVTVIDPIPPNTSLVPGTLTVNGISISSNPVSGIPLGMIAPGESYTIAFAVLVLALPLGNQIVNTALANYSFQLPDGRVLTQSEPSNSVTIQISVPLIDIIKIATPAQVVSGETVTYSFLLSNSSNVSISDILFIDLIPAGVSFVSGSVEIRGSAVTDANPNNGFIIQSISPKSSIPVSFQVSVDSGNTRSEIINQASLQYTIGESPFIVLSNPATIVVSFPVPPILSPLLPLTPAITLPVVPSPTLPSNPVNPSLPLTPPTIPVQKNASTSISEVGESIVYTIRIENSSAFPTTNLILKDKIQKEAVLVFGSVTVQGIPQPSALLESGLALKNLLPGESLEIRYRVMITRQPANGKLTNQATLSLNFQLPDGSNTPTSLASNKTIVSVVEFEE